MSRIDVARVRIPTLGIATCCTAVALAVALCASIVPARAQQRTTFTADAESPALSRDRARLAALGLDLSTLEQVTDAALLWRAVRELVLPGRVSVETQQRILRRVWLVDADIRQGSRLDSPTN
jgi:Asp/Glu/hydantoin racemase